MLFEFGFPSPGTQPLCSTGKAAHWQRSAATQVITSPSPGTQPTHSSETITSSLQTDAMSNTTSVLPDIQALTSNLANFKKFAAFAVRQLRKNSHMTQTERMVINLFKEQYPGSPCSFANNGKLKWSHLTNVIRLGAPLQLKQEYKDKRALVTLHYKNRNGQV